MLNPSISLQALIGNGLLLAAFLLLGAPPARATPFGVSFEASCGVQVDFGMGSNHTENGSRPGSIDLGCGGSGFAADFYGEGEDARTIASSIAGGSIGIGRVGVQLATKATSTPLIDGAIADASINASWWDTLKITGSSQGETVQLQLTGGIAGSMSCSGETAGSASYSVSWGQANGLNFSDDNCSSKLAGKQSAVLTLTVGQQVTIGGLILSSARAVAGNGCCGSYTLTSGNDVTAPDTFSLTITPLTPGAGYTSASGADYASGVPEPSIWAMMLIGFAGLGFIGLRGRAPRRDPPPEASNAQRPASASAQAKANRHRRARTLLLGAAMAVLAGDGAPAYAGTVVITGGPGVTGLSAGAGHSVTATTTTPSDPSNTATATGGNGGRSYGVGAAGVGGAGGSATSTATTLINSGPGSAEATATGGAGGAATYPGDVGGHGGAANATATTSVNSGAASAQATSLGGQGANGRYGAVVAPVFGGAGGAASSSATASSTTGSASATASSTSGRGGTGPDRYVGASASAGAAASSAGSGQAQASASAFSQQGDNASASAKAQNRVGEALTTASAPGSGPSALANAAVGSSSSESLIGVTAGQAVSNAVLTPSGPNIAVGAMSAAYGGSGSAVTYGATAAFNFSSSHSETLDLKLLSDDFADNSAGLAFDALKLQVDVSEKALKTFTFSSLTGASGAEKSFNADSINLGVIAGGSPIEIIYTLTFNAGTSAAPGDGFGFTYALVDPPPIAAIPEPSTWAMMLLGLAGLAFAGYRARATETPSLH